MYTPMRPKERSDGTQADQSELLGVLRQLVGMGKLLLVYDSSLEDYRFCSLERASLIVEGHARPKAS